MHCAVHKSFWRVPSCYFSIKATLDNKEYFFDHIAWFKTQSIYRHSIALFKSSMHCCNFDCCHFHYLTHKKFLESLKQDIPRTILWCQKYFPKELLRSIQSTVCVHYLIFQYFFHHTTKLYVCNVYLLPILYWRQKFKVGNVKCQLLYLHEITLNFCRCMKSKDKINKLCEYFPM